MTFWVRNCAAATKRLAYEVVIWASPNREVFFTSGRINHCSLTPMQSSWSWNKKHIRESNTHHRKWRLVTNLEAKAADDQVLIFLYILWSGAFGKCMTTVQSSGSAELHAEECLRKFKHCFCTVLPYSFFSPFSNHVLLFLCLSLFIKVALLVVELCNRR